MCSCKAGFLLADALGHGRGMLFQEQNRTLDPGPGGLKRGLRQGDHRADPVQLFYPVPDILQAGVGQYAVRDNNCQIPAFSQEIIALLDKQDFRALARPFRLAAVRVQPVSRPCGHSCTASCMPVHSA